MRESRWPCSTSGKKLCAAVANGTEMTTEGLRCWVWAVSNTAHTNQSKSIKYWISLHVWGIQQRKIILERRKHSDRGVETAATVNESHFQTEMWYINKDIVPISFLKCSSCAAVLLLFALLAATRLNWLQTLVQAASTNQHKLPVTNLDTPSHFMVFFIFATICIVMVYLIYLPHFALKTALLTLVFLWMGFTRSSLEKVREEFLEMLNTCWDLCLYSVVYPRTPPLGLGHVTQYSITHRHHLEACLVHCPVEKHKMIQLSLKMGWEVTAVVAALVQCHIATHAASRLLFHASQRQPCT